MNVARKIDLNHKTSTNWSSKKVIRTTKANIITLVSKEKTEEKEVTLDYLNERLAYFYNNGGPIMDI